MKTLFTHFTLLTILSFAIWGCSSGSEDSSNPDPKPIPDPDPEVPEVAISFLKEGTEYMYDYNNGLEVLPINMVVEKQLSKDTFLVRNYTETPYVNPTIYWVLKDNMWYSSYRLRDPDFYQVECKFGQPVGTSWTVTRGIYTSTYTIEAVDVTVKTGKGDVEDAIKLKIKDPFGDIEYSYVSPTVGPIGNGDYDPEGGESSLQLKDYTLGSLSKDENVLPAITFGDFPFMKVGAYWKFSAEDISGKKSVYTQEIIGKVDGKNIYKVKLTNAEETVYSNWYEDNGLLMSYEEGETLVQADPIYMDASVAKPEYGWTGTAKNGSVFIYRIAEMNRKTNTFFGELPCMLIDVTNFNTWQTNYWNQEKGHLSIDGIFLTSEVVSSNAKMEKRPFIPFLSL
ncbi:hypothetical protein AAG747_06635 [Rapidithrix thailandica]|uniref:Uncharacterized protein n=1 Tax=Rapidithrix thailandica TaxID=413964 RepID=A0AAW9RS31_9BACT